MKYKQTQKFGAPNSVSPAKFSLLSSLLWLVYGSVALLAVINLVGTNALATQGVVLDSILRQTDKTSRDNQTLSVEIGKISNLSYVESSATKLGFKRVTSTLVISPVEAVAAIIPR